jgi:metal-responsive CopG/Arc/MetJ family transcriptional regulator
VNKAKISIALNKNLIHKLDEESKKTQRSRSNLIEILIEKALSEIKSTSISSR